MLTTSVKNFLTDMTNSLSARSLDSVDGDKRYRPAVFDVISSFYIYIYLF
jgi:hypothetical protein